MAGNKFLSMIQTFFWGLMHALGHFLDFDKDGDLDVDDLKPVFAKFMEVLPTVLTAIPQWATMTLPQRAGAVLELVQAQMPDVKLKDWTWMILEAVGFAFHSAKSKALADAVAQSK